MDQKWSCYWVNIPSGHILFTICPVTFSDYMWDPDASNVDSALFLNGSRELWVDGKLQICSSPKTKFQKIGNVAS